MDNQSPKKISENDEKGRQPRENPSPLDGFPVDSSETHLLDALEVCRHGSDDLADPWFAPLAQRLADDPAWEERFLRVKRFDASLQVAFQDVPIPEGIEDRLIERLATVSNESNRVETEKTEGEEPEVVSPIAPRQRHSRRRLFAILGSVAVAAAVMVMVVLEWPREAEISKADIWNLANAQFNEDSTLFNSGQRVDHNSPLQSYRFSPDIVALQEMRWRWVDDFLGQKAVAYDLSLPDGTRATLYVEKRVVPGLPLSPPLNADNSGPRTVAAWQSDDLLYVMVVNRGQRTYQQLLRSLGPMT